MATTSSYVWRVWTFDSTATTATYPESSTVWGNWNTYGSTTTSSASSNEVVWITWQDAIEQEVAEEAAITYRRTGRVIHTSPLPTPTPEEQRAQRAQQEINRQWQQVLAEELRLEKEAAEQTAKELLLDLIGEEQLKVYEETGRLFVKGRKYDYIIHKGSGVDRIEKNKVVDLCIHLKERYSMPETDNVVALKLMIEGDEKQFNKVANSHGSKSYEELPKAACMGGNC